MSQLWSDYLKLIDSSSQLDGHRRSRIAEAEAAFAADGRRLAQEQGLAERNLEQLVARNTRLQIGVRELARSAGVRIPSAPDANGIQADALPAALTAAEFDLSQWRVRWDGLAAQRSSLTAPPVVASVPVPVPRPELAGGEPSPASVARFRPSPKMIAAFAFGAIVVIAVVIVLAVR